MKRPLIESAQRMAFSANFYSPMITCSSLTRFLSLALVLLASTCVTMAAVITPTAVNTTSEWVTNGDGWKNNMINGSGLSGSGAVETRVHDNVGNASTMWHAGPISGGISGGVTGNPPAVNTPRSGKPAQRQPPRRAPFGRLAP